MITSWGQIDSSWIGKQVVVRWEEPSAPLFDGGPSGIPHEVRGTVFDDPGGWGFGVQHDFGYWLVIPEHAHVQEVTE